MTTNELHLSILADLFRLADQAGYGIASGTSFEAYPGLEDAAADYIEALLNGEHHA